MKNVTFYILLIFLLVLTSCLKKENSMSLKEELEYAAQLHKDSDFDNAMCSYSRAILHPDITDEQQAMIFFYMSQIECNVRKDFSRAMKYISQSIALSSSEKWPIFYAYKGDFSMKYGVLDSAVVYCNKALNMPHKYTNVDYVCHYVLWQCFERMGMSDSAAYHENKYNAARVSGVFQTVTMDEIKRDLKCNIAKADGCEKGGYISTILTILSVVVVLLVGWCIKKWRHNKKSFGVSSGENTSYENNDILLEELLSKSVKAFESTSCYDTLIKLRIKEKELYKSVFDESEFLENTLFACFNEVSLILNKQYNLSSSDLQVLYYSYMGLSSNVIGYIICCTAGGVRKRNSRLKQKLSSEHRELFFGEAEK